MKAEILRAPNSKVSIKDRKRTTLGPAELLIRVRACAFAMAICCSSRAAFRSHASRLCRATRWLERLQKRAKVCNG